MILSRLFFRLVTSWWAMLLGNLFILTIVLFAMWTGVKANVSGMITDLRSETMSTIIIAWGVLLESREVLLDEGHAALRLGQAIERLLNREAARSGILLVCLGLLLEFSTYFDVDVRMEMLPSWISEALHAFEWVLLTIICVELVASCAYLSRIRLKKEA